MMTEQSEEKSTSWSIEIHPLRQGSIEPELRKMKVGYRLNFHKTDDGQVVAKVTFAEPVAKPSWPHPKGDWMITPVIAGDEDE